MAGTPLPVTPSWLVPLVERALQQRAAPAVLVAHDLTFARETIRLVARATGGVAGWRPETIRGVAGRLAAPALHAEGRRVADDVALRALIGESLVSVVADAVFARVRRLQDRPGFRRVVSDAVLALRAGGVTPDEAEAAAEPHGPDSPARLAARVLRAYEARLARAGLADPALVLQTALRVEVPDVASFVLMPTVADFGLSAALVARWHAMGAARLPAVPSHAAPTWEVSRAASPREEIRHVLRQVLEAGAPWDALEIAASDYETYAVALADEADRLGIPVTLRDGLPLARTRLGRAITRWFAWVRDDVPLESVRTAVLAGEWRSPHAEAHVPAVAAALQTMPVGWGRARWDAARAAKPADPVLDALLSSLLDRLPPVPMRGAAEPGEGDVASLAAALLAALPVLEAADPATAADESAALTRVRGRLEALTALPRETLPFASALAMVEEALDDVRWWPPLAADPGLAAARASRPGAVHCVPLIDAGVTGRAITALVGLDAERLAGATLGDVVLPDDVRAAFGGDPPRMPTLAMRTDAMHAQVDRAVARPAGRILASWTSVVPASAREVSADRRVLAAFRRANQGAGDVEALRKHAGIPRGAVPDVGVLDARDAWLTAIASDTVPHLAIGAIGSAFPGIARAVEVEASCEIEDSPAAMGFVADAAGRVGPPAGHATSASALERFGKCGLRWFYHDVLRVQPPERVEWEPGVWLDASTRGSWLHAVFERVGREVSEGRLDPDGAEAFADVQRILADVVAERAHEVPVPPPALRRRVVLQLEQQVRAWWAMMRDDRRAGTTWMHHELDLAPQGRPTDVPWGDGGAVRVRGRIDRVDRLADGRWRIVDYKTGKAPARTSAKAGPFDGGRRLQGPVYAAAAAAALGEPVEAFAYWYPSATGDDREAALDGDTLAIGHELVASVLADIAAGRFIPTDDPTDCRFCDQQAICRVVASGAFSVNSPRAAWVADRLESSPALVTLKRRRIPGGEA